VRRIARFLARLPALLREHRVQLALSIRVTIAALVALALARLLQLPLPLWAVLTAVIVTQMSVGRSLMATFDYLVGTLGGAIYGGAIGVLIPHASEIALLAVLALAVTPLAFIAAINPRFSVAPITAIIVLLIPTMTHATPFASALDRVIEVAASPDSLFPFCCCRQALIPRSSGRPPARLMKWRALWANCLRA
jgi:uncharacterized membrane protein YccC